MVKKGIKTGILHPLLAKFNNPKNKPNILKNGMKKKHINLQSKLIDAIYVEFKDNYF